jgi:hypothetical protein
LIFRELFTNENEYFSTYGTNGRIGKVCREGGLHPEHEDYRDIISLMIRPLHPDPPFGGGRMSGGKCTKMNNDSAFMNGFFK